MISARAVQATRARLAFARRTGAGADDGGFALLLVMLVVTLITAALVTAMTTLVPNITAARDDQANQAALAAAYAGVDDFIAMLSSTDGCRTRVCNLALGDTSAAQGRNTTLAGSSSTFSWASDPALTSDLRVRVRSTGHSGKASRTIVADVGLTNPFLDFGYYSDYESQASSYVLSYSGDHTVDIADKNSAADVYTTGTSRYGSTVRVRASAGDTIHWTAPGVNSLSPQVCDRHWYNEKLPNGTTLTGRANYPNQSAWGQNGVINGNTVSSYTSCDVNFVTGITFDGPLYTRDALLVSDGTTGGLGPNFKAPVSTLWGTPSYNSPAPSNPAQPWRTNDQVGGQIGTVGSYKPSNVDPTTGQPVPDLQLPSDVATDDLPDDACIYTGPTRVVLNGDGTATITSPTTTAVQAGSDPNCYPSSVKDGVGVDAPFVLNYHTVGNNTIVVHNLGTEPASGWPQTGQKSTSTPSASNTAFYLPNPAAPAVTGDTDTSAAPDSCVTTTKYSATAGSDCAWTDVNSASDPGGWAAYTPATQCNSSSLVATDREQFECDYAGLSNATTPTSDGYKALRTAFKAALTSGGNPTCSATASAGAQASCLQNKLSAALTPLNTNASNTSKPLYNVTATPVTSTTTTKTLGAAATPAPTSTDPMFTTQGGGPATEQVTTTTTTLSVSRQVRTCSGVLNWLGVCLTYSWGDGKSPGASVPQFSTTVTQVGYSNLVQPKPSATFFPSMNDVTQYSTATSSGAAPGDLYVQGNNQGVLSMVADNDVILTGALKNTSSNTDSDAVDVVAGNNVRNYHPVQCADQTAADINATSPGWCPNDISNLYSSNLTNSDGTLQAQHPAAQYVNMPVPITNPNNTLSLGSAGDVFPPASSTCPSSASSTNTAPADCRQFDAAIFALNGSFLTDNYNRGAPLGSVAINGGLYQSHRGTNGIQWEYRSGDPKRASSGANLQYHYVDLQHRGLPFAPASTTGAASRPWSIVSVSNGGGA